MKPLELTSLNFILLILHTGNCPEHKIYIVQKLNNIQQGTVNSFNL